MLLVAPCRVLWCCCRSVAILLLELLLLTTAYMQQCCWLSMSIGGSGGTAVRNKKRRSRGRPPWFGGACLLWPPFVASPQLAVLPYGTYDNQVLCALVYVFCVGAVFFCDRLSFLTCVVYGVRHQSYFFVSPPPPPEALVGYVMTGLQVHFLSRLYANTSLQNTYKYWKGVHDFWVWENNFMHTQYQGTQYFFTHSINSMYVEFSFTGYRCSTVTYEALQLCTHGYQF